jgi:putative phosphoesterase
MKILVISDTHQYENIKEYTVLDKFDHTIHLGDSELFDLNGYDTFVRGNCDFNDADDDATLKANNFNIFITHGHLYNVNYSDELIVKTAKEKKCNIVLHGHTHIVKISISNGVLIINPGSQSSSRSSYSETFMIVDINEDIVVNLYDAKSCQLIETRKVLNEEIFNNSC